jgi:TolB-like protein/class 3 adenylate cyclase
MAKRQSRTARVKKIPSKEQRRLSVIMFTDMVGYSALTQKDEALALRLLEEHRQILRSIFLKRGGKEIKTIGDAFLVEFSSALDATQSAIEIQRELFERNRAAQDVHPIQIRIGLHVGDVVFKERDVYGDGVNIASRIEPLAEPGGICISEDVARQIQNKIEYPLVGIGKGELKNIDLTVNLYRIVLPWKKHRFGFVQRLVFAFSQKRIRRISLASLIFLSVIGVFLWRSAHEVPGVLPKKNIAVLPLLNIGADPHQEYFADGMTEELISNLAKVRDLSVIARTSVAKYKGVKLDVAEIGRALNVGSVLEGSVQTSANRARIIVNLIDVASQQQLWSQEYDRELKDLFAIQSDIAMSVTSALRVELLSGERELLAKRGTENDVAHDLYLQGLSHFNKRTGDEIVRAIDFFAESVKQDSSFALAFAGLAECYTLAGNAGYGSLPREQAIAKAKYFASKAIALDPSEAEAHTSLGYVKFRIDWDWAGAESEFKRALELKPGYARAHELYGLYLSLMARFDEALAEMKRAQELDPLSPGVGTGVGRVLHFSERFDEAVTQFRKTLRLDPDYAEAHFALGMTFTAMKRYQEADQELTLARRLSGDRPAVIALFGVNLAKWGKRAEALAIVRQLNEMSRTANLSVYYSGLVYAGLGDLDKALVCMEQAYKEREGLLVYGNVEPDFKTLRSDHRFIALLKKMGIRK